MVCFALIGLVAWGAASLFWTESVERSYGDLSRVLGYAGALGLVLLAVSRRTWEAAAGGLCAAAIAVPLLAVLDRLFPELFGFYALSGFERLSYPLGYWNALAAWASMAIVIALALSSHLRSPGLRGLCLGVVPLLGLAQYLTLSRGGVLATAAGIVTFLFLARSRFSGLIHVVVGGVGTAALIVAIRGYPELATATGDSGAGVIALLAVGVCVVCGLVASRTRRLSPPMLLKARSGSLIAALVVAAAVAGAALGVKGEGITGAQEQFTSGRYPSQGGDPAARLTTLEGGRSEIWESAIRAFSSEPITGIGPGAFELWWTRDVAEGEELREPHSLLLGQLAEQGLVGAAIMLLLLALLTAGAVRAARTAQGTTGSALALALCSAWIAFLLQAQVDWLWETTALAMLALVGAAVLVASQAEGRSSRSRRRSAQIRYPLAALAILAGAATVPGIVAVERVRASFSQLVIGDTTEALETADEGVSAAPWLASPYATRAIVRLRATDVSSARADALKAIDLEPTNWRHRVLLAAIEDAAGDEAASAAALSDAKDLNPDQILAPAPAIDDITPGDG
jgi:tetratricopeptide (TPR) repeat protein